MFRYRKEKGKGVPHGAWSFLGFQLGFSLGLGGKTDGGKKKVGGKVNLAAKSSVAIYYVFVVICYMLYQNEMSGNKLEN